MVNTQQASKHLAKLKESDFEVVDGQPDIRGWEVKDREGKKVGKVDDLIFDVQARKVRYMVVDTKNSDYDITKKYILVPIGLGELHSSDDDVYLPGVSAEQIKGYPEYNNEDITSEHEASVRNLFPINDPDTIGVAGLGLAQPDNYIGYYDNYLFNESNLFTNRKKSVIDDNPMHFSSESTAEERNDVITANFIRSKNK